MIKKILVIGGEGYIGKVVCEDLVKKKHNVISLDNLIYNQDFNKKLIEYSNYKFILDDIRNIESIKKIVQNVDSIIILAGLVGDPITKKYPIISNEINFLAIKNLIDVSLSMNIERVIFVSTCSNYGILPENDLAIEETILNPLSIYAKDKVNIENYILSKKNMTDTCLTILRFATAFGLSDRMRFDLTINEFTKDLFLGKNLEVFDPDTWRPYCHIRDFSKIINEILFIDKNKIFFEIYNAGSDINNYTKRMIAEKIFKILNNGKISYIEKKDSDPRNYKVNFNKLKKLIDFKADYNIEKGINEILDFLTSKKKYISNMEKFGNYIINK